MKGRPLRDGELQWVSSANCCLVGASMKGRPLRDGDAVAVSQ